ncbi:DUF3307 domain-containing protein [Proteiniclasticum sp. SCR006]|uniref:DUF3307 domain-containing protein n=1 Tax=Proteiniclasticum aestuarii TaxID=2817862 RepID=A0A939HCT6_9CLOT|nr:DUF3307 domain-containing protein [Proteiniclasticum aestuarii]MBO1265190.1 DUF3307 domain-containing protein [Proteiniclasticum aestuarii]
MFTLSMLISHTLTDFVIQTDSMVKAKSERRLRGFLLHGGALLLTALPFLMLLAGSSFISASWKVLIIIASHLVIDYLKEGIHKHLERRAAPKISRLQLFLSDQILHIAVILLVTSGSSMEYNGLSLWLTDTFMRNSAITYESAKRIFLVLYIAFSGAYFIPLMLDKVYEKVEGYTDILNMILKVGEDKVAHGFIDEVKAGKWIGIMERILMVIFLYSNQISSIGFIIAVKSLARFKMMENKIFAEYYLMGTLLSVVYTFIAYGALESIL